MANWLAGKTAPARPLVSLGDCPKEMHFSSVYLYPICILFMLCSLSLLKVLLHNKQLTYLLDVSQLSVLGPFKLGLHFSINVLFSLVWSRCLFSLILWMFLYCRIFISNSQEMSWGCSPVRPDGMAHLVSFCPLCPMCVCMNVLTQWLSVRDELEYWRVTHTVSLCWNMIKMLN